MHQRIRPWDVMQRCCVSPDVLAYCHCTSMFFAPLNFSAYISGHFMFVVHLLQNGMTPLLLCAEYGDAGVARILLEAGADIEQRTVCESLH
jgi:ankyrin repeat protein